ncbi:hypothetical protein BGW39_001849, partial [Mortierella sp. 14UC]
MDTVEITLNHVDGQNIVYWEDIEQVFPGVKRVRNGNSVIKFLRGFDQQSSRLVLDVVLSTSVEPILANPSKFDPVGLLDTSSSPSSATSATSKATLFQQIVTHASRKARKSEVEQRFISLLAPEVQETVRASSDIYQAFAKAINDGDRKLSGAELRQDRRFKKLEAMVGRNLELQEALYAKQEETKQLQEAMYAKQEEAKELQEQDPSSWYIADPFSNKFRLYYLCECREHTKSIDSKTEIHFAKHEGYEIARPTEFFQLYGSHVFAILKMLKFSISVAGVAVPAISHLVRADFIDQAATYLQLLKDIEPVMDPVIDWMDKVSANEGEDMQNKEALAGADLRKLNTFLKAKDGDKVLGNLYRTVTDEGHVKWVCIDHYRENYQDSTAKDFQRMLDSVGGSFDKSIGRVAVALRSRVLAEQFFSALGKARSVYELDIDLDWACTTSDLEALEDTLMKSRVSILRLDLRQFRSSAVSKGADQASRVSTKKSTHVCKMSCELASTRIGGKEFGMLAEALKTNSALTTLDLQRNSIGSDGAKALAEALKINSTGHPTAELLIPKLIDDYNHYMNGVDISDQYRSYYSTQLTVLRTWMPLFFWIFDTTIIDCYRIYT